MSHQTVNENDFVSERTTQTLKDFTNSKKINQLEVNQLPLKQVESFNDVMW